MTYTDGNGSTEDGSLTYDRIGNPLTYFNGRENWYFTWKFGRQLTGASSGSSVISYAYDVDGIRQSKTVNGSTTKFTTLDGKVVRETTGGVTVDYFYDNEGKPYKLEVAGSVMNYVGYYVLNQQGDVVAILDDTGDVAVTYEYNAWGKILAETGTGTLVSTYLKSYNRLKYRGYYYDAEPGFYYVSSRYYDPEIGRFISADGEISGVGGDITGYNLYSYCGNNPVNRIDPDGHAWKDVKNWFSNTWNKVKKTAKKIVTTVKKKAYSVYYKATKWHFEDRAKKNGAHPSYSDVNKKNSGWNLLPKSQSVYHDNGIGKSELKYITDDGREAVFDGDTLAPVTDPRYIATYNYSPLYQMPSSGAGVSDYAKLAGSGIGHFFADMLPYYLTGNSNTREQFESKIFIFD